MRRIRLFGIVLGATIIAVAGCSRQEDRKTPAAAQPPTATVGSGGAGANLNSDGEFVRDVAIKTMAAIELSRMALEKTTSAEIKSYAQLIIGGHTVVSDKLKGAISGASIAWPAQLDDTHRKTADDLAMKQGADFDRDYLEAMIEGQTDLAAKLESRLDVQSLADWKTAAAARTQVKAAPGAQADVGGVIVRPSKSDKDLTTKINQWAAETYPIAQKHLDTARTLETGTKRPSR